MNAEEALAMADQLLELGDRYKIAAYLLTLEHEAHKTGLEVMAQSATEIIRGKS